MGTAERLTAIYEALYAHFGPQGWWPGETPLEVMVGAILTQNTNWANVEKAIANLKGAGLLTLPRLLDLPTALLAEYIRPAGYFNIKAARLHNLLRLIAGDHDGDLAAFGGGKHEIFGGSGGGKGNQVHGKEKVFHGISG